MSNANNPANPSDVTYEKDGVTVREIATGSTKREHFAGLAMSAWIQHHGSKSNYGYSDTEMSESAVHSADALLKELEK